MANFSARDKWTLGIAIGFGIPATALRFIGNYDPTQSITFNAYPGLIHGLSLNQWVLLIGMCMAMFASLVLGFIARRLPLLWSVALLITATSGEMLAQLLNRDPYDYSNSYIFYSIVGVVLSLPGLITRFVRGRIRRRRQAAEALKPISESSAAWPPEPTAPDRNPELGER